MGTSVDPETEKHSVRHSNEDNDSISGVEEAEVTAGTISTFGAHSPETQRATTNPSAVAGERSARHAGARASRQRCGVVCLGEGVRWHRS